MEDRDDRDLLRKFVGTRDEQAFAELVRRYVDLVYSAARRQTADQAAAQDVTQTVFILLIEKAGTIRAGEALAGWLLVSTRYAALNLLRAESRRRRHDSEAAAMKSEQTPDHATGEWERIQPMLDHAVSELNTSDRDALVLRYFQNKSLAEVGRAMGISEPAAQKRVNRAIHRLRKFFARQGITTSADAISSAMSAFAIAAAPAAMSGEVAKAAISTAKVVATQTATLSTKGAALLMASVKTKIAVTAAVLLVAGIGGTSVYVARHAPAKSESASSKPAIAINAPPPTTSPDPKMIFNAAYALEPNEIAKRVLPPYIPERSEVIGSTFLINGRNRPPTAAGFIWNGAQPTLAFGYQRGNPKVWSLFQYFAKTWPQETDIPQDILNRDVSGDWVVRIGAGSNEIMAALATSLADEIGPGMTIRAEPMERDVIVARGKFQFTSVIDSPDQNYRDRIIFFRGATVQDGKKLRIQSNGNDVESTLKTLGRILNRRIVIEGEFGDQKHDWAADPSCDFVLFSEKIADDTAIDEILANVAKQTSLQFTREKRTLPTWRLVRANP